MCMKKLLLLPLCIIFSLSLVFACSLTLDAQTVAELKAELSDLNTGLTECPVEIPTAISRFYKNGNFLFNIDDNYFMVMLQEGQLVSVTEDTANPNYNVFISQADFESILQSSDKAQTATFLYSEGKIRIEAISLGGKVGLFFVKPILYLVTRFA